MTINDFLGKISFGASLQIFMEENNGESGKLQDIDWENEALILLSDEDGEEKVIPFDQIVNIDLDEEKDKIPDTSIEGQLKNISLGKYLMIWGNYGEAINQTIKQGKLKNIDWDKRTLVLTSTTYKDTEHTVPFDQITSIDTSREQSGALGSVQTPDLRNAGGKWVRGSTEVGSKGYEEKKRRGTL